MVAETAWGRSLCVLLLTCLLACGQATTRMQPGVPLEVKRGYCLLNTEYKQRGKLLNRDDVMQRLARNEKSGPYVASGNAFAIGSIIATVVATPAIIVGSAAKEGNIHMSDGASTGLLVGGVAVGVLSVVLCITSDGKYASAAETYNEHFTTPAHDQEDDRVDDKSE